MSTEAINYTNKQFGTWAVHAPNSCKVCAFDSVERVHEQAYTGLSLDKIIDYCHTKFDFTVSKATLSRHFKNHFIKSENRNLDLTSLSPLSSITKDTSLNELLSQIDKREANFFDSVSHLVKSKLVQYKNYEDLADVIREELDKSQLSDSGEEIPGIIMTDRHTSDLFKRFVYLEKEKNIVNSEVADIIFKAQNILVKTDQEYIKNFVQMTKKFLIQQLVNQLGTLLSRACTSGVISDDQRSELAKSMAQLLEMFESEMRTDLLFQKSLELMKDEEMPGDGK